MKFIRHGAARRKLRPDTEKMNLREAVEKYRELAGSYGKPVPLAAFGLSREETERAFSIFDEDYHISRFFHFSLDPGAGAAGRETYEINGFPHTHVSLDSEIQTIL